MSDCSKIYYPNRAVASFAMRAIASRYEARDLKGPAGVYFCTPCKGWHLTSKSGTQIAPWEKARSKS